MSKETIAVDIDDVLSAENEAMRQFINERYGLNLTAKDYLVEAPYWGYWERVWGVDEEEALRRYQAYLEAEVKARHLPVEGAVEGVSTLKDEYNLVVVTSRYDSFVDLTKRWLEEHFPEAFSGVEFVEVWSKIRKVSKAIICKEIEASYLIDDNLEHCTLAAEEGVTGLLFGEYGWNKADSLPSGVIRVKDWSAVLEYFSEK